MRNFFLLSITIFIFCACSADVKNQRKSARDLHRKSLNQSASMALGNQASPQPSPSYSASPTPVPPLPSPADSCQDLLDQASGLYDDAANTCQACSELWQACENCLNSQTTDDNDGIGQDICNATCGAEYNCYQDALNNFTFPLRELNSQYIDQGCMTATEKTIGNIPVYDACSAPAVSPTPTEDAPPPTPIPSPEITPSPSPDTTPYPSPYMTPYPSPDTTPYPSPYMTPYPS